MTPAHQQRLDPHRRARTRRRSPRSFFVPAQVWRANYFDALPPAAARTKLLVMPAQYRSDGAAPHIRTYSNLHLSSSTARTRVNAAQAAAPAITNISGPRPFRRRRATTFQATVTGDPARASSRSGSRTPATGTAAPTNGSRSISRPSRATRTSTPARSPLPSGSHSGNVRFIVQAVNGAGSSRRRQPRCLQPGLRRLGHERRRRRRPSSLPRPDRAGRPARRPPRRPRSWPGRTPIAGQPAHLLDRQLPGRCTDELERRRHNQHPAHRCTRRLSPVGELCGRRNAPSERRLRHLHDPKADTAITLTGPTGTQTLGADGTYVALLKAGGNPIQYKTIWFVATNGSNPGDRSRRPS